MFIGKRCSIYILTGCFLTNFVQSRRFGNRVPFSRGKDPAFPNFSEDDIPTGFVNSYLIYPYTSPADHPCNRICSFDRTLICYFQFVLEEFESYNEQACSPECLSLPPEYDCFGCIRTDGVKTRLMSINRQMPGPPINVCLNDLIIVDVVNNITEPTTMHWHGMDQSLSPYMDGVPFVTQAEIPPQKIYRYKFIAGNHGTNFYHSHSLWQRGQGIYGIMTVGLPPLVNPHWDKYHYDLTANCIIISDWGYNIERRANAYLIHGKGLSSYSQGIYRGAPKVYYVSPNFRYRYRIVFNGVNNIQVEFSIEGHLMKLIAADGAEIKPVLVNSMVLNAGERFDFVLDANQPIGNYWMRVTNPLNRTLFQVAIVHYEGAPMVNPETEPNVYQRPAGMQVNTLNVGPGTAGTITVAELRGLHQVPWLSQVQWETTYLGIDVNLQSFNFEIDKISMKMPPVPLLVEKDRIDDRLFCNRTTLTYQGIDCSQTICQCTHVIQYKLNAFIELIFFSESLHPAHLHGFWFYVLGMGVVSQPMTRELIIEMDHRGEIYRNYDSPILKDTIQVPRRGYVIVALYAFNPGYWFLHCHIETHALRGMAVVLQIGQPNEMLPQPANYRPYPT